MSIFFTSDTHFGHSNILKYCSSTRGHFAHIDDMDTTLIRNWNRVVSPNDTIYHLGDFAFSRVNEYLQQLNGHKHIILGNHDKALKKAFRKAFNKTLKKCTIHQGYHEASFNGVLVVMNHYAQRVWNRSHYGALHLYGHSHGTLPGLGKSVDVGVDSTEMGLFTGDNLRPYSLEEVVGFLTTGK